jgi:hypothetical protein
MVDWVVLFTPLLVLVVVALLGFAGCGFSVSVRYNLAIRVRVPTALTVTQVVFRWTPPGGTVVQKTLSAPTDTDGADNIYEHGFWQEESPPGMWLTNCRVTAQDGTGSAVAGGQGDFFFSDPEPTVVATYQASGSPSGGNFAVSFAGAFEEVSA